ncbi:hypothetical protein V8E55_010223 [Tylopilus felleus]
MVDKAFESRAAGGLTQSISCANLVTPTLVARKGTVPPPPAWPKPSQKSLPPHVCVFEPAGLLKLDSLSLNPSDITTRNRSHVPTPFPGRETDESTNGPDGSQCTVSQPCSNKNHQEDNSDPNSPPFTQRKWVCHIVLSDNNEPTVGQMVAHGAKPAKSKGDSESFSADSIKLAVGNELLAPSSSPTALSHDTASGKKTTKNRPKASDYDPITRRILFTAIQFYCAYLLTKNPFPDAHNDNEWARDAWDMSCEYYQSMDINLDVDLMTLELHPRRAGIYRHKVIQQIINEVLFSTKADDGIKWAEYYNPFPSVAFALTLTAIECAIDEWASGRREMIPFKEDQYKGRYTHPLETLEYFHQRTHQMDILPKIQQQVFNNGRLYAGVDIVQEETSSTACIPEDVIQDAIKEFGQEVGREMDKGDEVDEVVDDEQEIDGVDDGIDVQMDGYAEDQMDSEDDME